MLEREWKCSAGLFFYRQLTMTCFPRKLPLVYVRGDDGLPGDEPFFNAHMASIDVTTTEEPNAAKQQIFYGAEGLSPPTTPAEFGRCWGGIVNAWTRQLVGWLDGSSLHSIGSNRSQCL